MRSELPFGRKETYDLHRAHIAPCFEPRRINLAAKLTARYKPFDPGK